jgi:TP901 family phage tail tape measure protein
MPAQSEELLFILKMRDEASRILQGYENELKNTGGHAQDAKSQLQELQRAAKDVAFALGAVVAQTATWRATVGVFGEYETGMLGVAKTTGLAGQEFEGFTEQFDVMAAELTLPIERLQEIAQVAGQVGVTGSDNILNFTRHLAMLSDASDVVGGEGAESLARLLNVTEEGVENVGNVAAAMVALGNASAATESKILRTATVIGQSLASFDVASHEVLGLATSVAEVGQAGELAGTTFFKAFRVLKDAALEGGEQLELLAATTGRSMEEVKDAILEHPVEGFQIFLEAMRKVRDETGSTAAFLEQFNLKGAENSRVLDPLVEQLGRMAKNLDLGRDAFGQATAHIEEYERAAQGLERQQQRLTNIFELAGKTIGGDVAPTVKAAIQVIASAVLGLTQAYQALPDAVQTTISHLVVFGPSVVGVAVAVRHLTTAFKLLRLAMIGTPWGAAYAAVSLLVGGLALLAAGTAEAEEAALRHEEAIAVVNQVLDVGETATKGQIELARQQAQADLEAAQAALTLAEARMQAIPVDPTGEFGFFGDVAVAEREAEVLRERIKEIEEALVKLKQRQIEVRAASGEIQGPPKPPTATPQTGEQKEFVTEVEERIRVLQTEAEKLREGTYAFEQYQAAQRTEGEIKKIVEDAKELGLNVDELTQKLRDAAAARQATETELARSTFRAELERTIVELDKEAQAIRGSAAAYAEYQDTREIEQAVADFAEEARNLGFTRTEVDKLSQAYREAARARQQALLADEQADFRTDVNKTVAELRSETLALQQGEEAYERYQRARAIQSQVEEIRKTAEALRLEQAEVRRLEQEYRAAAQARADAAERLEMENELRAEAKQLVEDLGVEFARSAGSMVLESKSAEDAIRGLIKAIAEVLVQTALLKTVQLGVDAAFTHFGAPWTPTGTGGELISSTGTDTLEFHRGGVVGSTPVPTRLLPASLFARAPRFHGGLADDEFAAVLRRGERVLTQDLDQRAQGVIAGLAERGGTVVNVNTTINVAGGSRGPAADRELARQISAEMEAVIDSRITDQIRHQMRSGNLLNPTRTAL